MMGRSLRLLFGLLLLGLGLAVLSLTPPVDSAPLAQATATPTATRTPTITPTATLPRLVPYGDGMAVQSFPEARINCTLDVAGARGGGFECVSGTPVPPRPTPVPPVDLTTGLAHRWPLEGTGGAWPDTIGTAALTAEGGVTAAAGLIGNAAVLDGADGTYLHSEVSTDLAIPTGAAFTVALWVNLRSIPDLTQIWPSFWRLRADDGNTPLQLWLYDNGGSKLAFFVSDETGTISLQQDILWSPSLSTWHQIVAGYAPSVPEWRVALDGGAIMPFPATFTVDPRPVAVRLGGEPFAGYGVPGAEDEVRYYLGRAPDQALVDGLWNGGVGAP